MTEEKAKEEVKIVIWDDKEMILDLIDMILKKDYTHCSYNVIYKHTEIQAIKDFLKDEEKPDFPDILLIDMEGDLDEAAGLEIINFVIENALDIKIIVYSSYMGHSFNNWIQQSIGKVCAYLHRDFRGFDYTAEMIWLVHKWGNVNSPFYNESVIKPILESFQRQNTDTPKTQISLSNSEKKLLKYVAQGWEDRKIAEDEGLIKELQIKEDSKFKDKMINHHLQRISTKIGIPYNRVSLVVWAIKNDFLNIGEL